MDPIWDTDWAAHWRALVEAREATGPARGQDGFWDRRAKGYAFSMSRQADPFLDFVQPWLGPSRTLIDVGAGTGRHAAPLAERLDWVTAVEPSQGMRERIPEVPNMTVVATTWEDADVAPADLVMCAHVLYPIAEPVPFIEKMEASARERVFIVIRDQRNAHPAELIAERPREPMLRDCFNLLRQMDVAPDVAMFRYPVAFHFESLEAAVEECRLRLGERWDDGGGRHWLRERLRKEGDAAVVFQAGEMTSGVLHWRPRT